MYGAGTLAALLPEPMVVQQHCVPNPCGAGAVVPMRPVELCQPAPLCSPGPGMMGKMMARKLHSSMKAGRSHKSSLAHLKVCLGLLTPSQQHISPSLGVVAAGRRNVLCNLKAQ